MTIALYDTFHDSYISVKLSDMICTGIVTTDSRIETSCTYLILVVRDEGDVDHFLFTDDADEAVGVEGGAGYPHGVPVDCAVAAGAVVAPFLVALFAKHLQSKQ